MCEILKNIRKQGVVVVAIRSFLKFVNNDFVQ